MEDRAVAMHARHAIAKTPADISELIIACNRGCIDLCGKLKKPRGYQGEMNLRKELDVIKEQIRHVHGVKEVFSDRLQILD
jgi:hypothetical protein